MITFPGLGAGVGSVLTSKTSTSPVLSIAIAFIVLGNDIVLEIERVRLPEVLRGSVYAPERWRATWCARNDAICLRATEEDCAMTHDGTILIICFPVAE